MFSRIGEIINKQEKPLCGFFYIVPIKDVKEIWADTYEVGEKQSTYESFWQESVAPLLLKEYNIKESTELTKCHCGLPRGYVEGTFNKWSVVHGGDIPPNAAHKIIACFGLYKVKPYWRVNDYISMKEREKKVVEDILKGEQNRREWNRY